MDKEAYWEQRVSKLNGFSKLAKHNSTLYYNTCSLSDLCCTINIQARAPVLAKSK